MDYKKMYEEALKRAKGFKSAECKDVAEYIFPELKESEDERTRKAILNYFTKCWGNCKDDVCGIHVEDAIDWLEKQGDKDKLIQELGEYKVKYTQEVLSQQLEKQKPVEFCEEDEKIRRVLIELVKCNERSGYELLNNVPTSSMIAWLEKQKPVEWNEEDEGMLQALVCGMGCYTYFSGIQSEDIVNWLKSLKQRFKKE